MSDLRKIDMITLYPFEMRTTYGDTFTFSFIPNCEISSAELYVNKNGKTITLASTDKNNQNNGVIKNIKPNGYNVTVFPDSFKNNGITPGRYPFKLKIKDNSDIIKTVSSGTLIVEW